LISMPNAELESKGIKYTPREIASQPTIWLKSFSMLKNRIGEIRDFINGRVLSKGHGRVMLSGAGSSYFIGLSCEDVLRGMWHINVESRACTDIVTSFHSILLKHIDTTMVYFSRSGESPEILGAFLLADRILENVSHIIITCNRFGKLASLKSRYEERGENNVLRIILPEETNDRGLAMTASFTTMLMAAQFLAYIMEADIYENILRSASAAAERLLREYSSLASELAELNFERAFFLGTGPLYGCAAESHLKLQELTAGRVICKFDSYLGVRHGPEIAIDDKTLIVYFVSSDPFIRRYEIDLMEDLRSKGLGLRRIAVCCGMSESVKRYADHVIDISDDGRCWIPDYCRPLVDVIFGQLLGLFKSLNLGLKPDNPSDRGIITRVVRGVKIYDYEAYKSEGQFRVIAQ
ncbi:MAG: SIS domain-containing protein, partial [Candidatus Bathyarchaeia archaeon]